MKLVVYGDATASTVASCSGTNFGRNCTIAENAVFSVGVVTNPSPSGGFTAYKAVLKFNPGNISLVQQPNPDENVWPDCDPSAFVEDDTTPGEYSVTCGTGGSTNVVYNGGLALVQFRCDGSNGTINLEAAAGVNTSVYIRSGIPSTLFLNGPDQVQIDCVPPTPTRTSTSTATPTSTPTPIPPPNVFVDPASVTTAGGAVTLDIRVEDVNDLGRYDLVVNWDPSVLSFSAISNGAFLGSTGRVVLCPGPTLGPGTLSFGCSTIGITPGPNGDGVLARLTFATGSAGTSSVDLSGVVLRDTLGQVMAVTTESGSVTVQATSTSGFPASADTYVQEDDANKNYGADDRMHVKSDPTKLRHSLVQFDLSSVPPGSDIQSATLRLCFTKVQTGRVLNVKPNVESWAETAVTWNTRPAASSGVSATITVPSTEICMDSTVTADVQAWVAGVANYGWRIQDQNETTNSSDSRLATRENSTAGIRPSLQVVYTSCTDTTPPAAPASLVAASDDNGVALDWDDNAESDLAGYFVYRSDPSGSTYTKLSASAIAASNMIDTTADGGVTYSYVVTAVDGCGNESSDSAPATALALASLNIHDDYTMDHAAAANGTIHVHDDVTEYFKVTAPVRSATNLTDWTLVLVLDDKPDTPAQVVIEIWWQDGEACSDGPLSGQVFASGNLTVPVAVDGLGMRLTVPRTPDPVSRTFDADDLLCMVMTNLDTGGEYDVHAHSDLPSTSGEPGVTRLVGPFASP